MVHIWSYPVELDKFILLRVFLTSFSVADDTKNEGNAGGSLMLLSILFQVIEVYWAIVSFELVRVAVRRRNH